MAEKWGSMVSQKWLVSYQNLTYKTLVFKPQFTKKFFGGALHPWTPQRTHRGVRSAEQEVSKELGRIVYKNLTKIL